MAAKRAEATSWLEYGCGSGAAVTYASKRFEVGQFHLLDVSMTALKMSKSRLEQALEMNTSPALHLLAGGERSLAIESETIDIANVESSLYYNSRKDFEAALREIHRVKKPGGIGRFCIKADDDRYCKQEFRIAEMTYKINKPGHWEDGMTICCMPYEKVLETFSMFSSLIIGKEAMGYTNINETKSFWVITTTK